MYNNSCQICGLENETLMKLVHIKPLTLGEDPSISNMLLLCPNDYDLFDKGLIGIKDNLDLVGSSGRLNVSKEHVISKESLKWHRNTVLKN